MGSISSASVRAIIIKDEHMLVEWYEPRSVCFTPGGRIEPGEKIEQTIERELKEELGTIAIVRERYLGRFFNRCQDDGPVIESTDHFFACSWKEADVTAPVTSGEEGREFRWIPLAGLEKSNLMPPQLAALVLKYVHGVHEEWDFSFDAIRGSGGKVL